MSARIAVVGQGVAGCSSALALLEKFPKLNVTLFANNSFEQSCSYGPAGLFRLDKYETRDWARASFERFAYLERHYGPKTGVKLVSGHIQSDSLQRLEMQERNMADIVYNFRWLTDRETHLLFDKPSKYCIHYTAYASEGRMYVPWLYEQLKERGAQFVKRDFNTLDEVAKEGYDIVINCTGLNGAKIAGDDTEGIIPVRGIGIEVEAPWHKHFNYRDFTTFTIPLTNSVILGTVKQENRSDTTITDEDRKDMWRRYLEIHPRFEGVKVLSEFCSLRPERKTIRCEYQKRNDNGKVYHVIHNYGHGSNGFTLGWGCAQDVVKFVEPLVN